MLIPLASQVEHAGGERVKNKRAGFAPIVMKECWKQAKSRHILHFLLSVLTFGFWIALWILIAVVKTDNAIGAGGRGPRRTGMGAYYARSSRRGFGLSRARPGREGTDEDETALEMGGPDSFPGRGFGIGADAMPPGRGGRRGGDERGFLFAVLQLARSSGWRAYHTHDSRRSEPGFPDVVLARAGRIVFAELKTKAGRVTAEQRGWLDALRKAKGPAVSVFLWTPADWPTIETTLARRAIEPERTLP